MKFCPNLFFMYREHPFLERFEAAARDGFEDVEICFAYEFGLDAVKHALAETGQRLVSFNFPAGEVVPGGKRGLAGLPGYEAAFKAQIELGLEWAQALDIPRGIAPLAGIVPAGLARDEAWQTYLANMQMAARLAHKAGVVLLVEPHNTVEHPGYLVNLMAHARCVVDHVNSPNVRILLDSFHTQIMEGNLTGNFLEHRHLIDHIQVGSVPGRHEPVHGEVNHGFLFSLFKAHGYDGWIAGEYFPKAGTSEGLGWRVELGLDE